jgi:hypothetical protein
MGKTSKEYYTETFEGIRMFGCGVFGMVSNLVEWGYGKARSVVFSGKSKRKEKVIDVEEASIREG